MSHQYTLTLYFPWLWGTNAYTSHGGFSRRFDTLKALHTYLKSGEWYPTPAFAQVRPPFGLAKLRRKLADEQCVRCFTRYDVCYAYRIELPGDYPAPDPWWHLARYDGRLHLLLDEQEHQAAANGEPAPELGPYAHTRPPVTTRATD